jgi:hypothetical protein
MNITNIKNIAAEIILSVIRERDGEQSLTEKQAWLEAHAAVQLVKTIVENDPVVFLEEITPEEAEEAVELGKS